MSQYDMIDLLTVGLDQKTGISETTRKLAKHMATVLVSRVYLDKVSDHDVLQQLSNSEYIWTTQFLQGMEALAHVN